MPQESCSAAAGAAGKLDRLSRLQKVIAPAVVRQCLDETGWGEQRSCHLTHEMMPWAVLAMVTVPRERLPITMPSSCSLSRENRVVLVRGDGPSGAGAQYTAHQLIGQRVEIVEPGNVPQLVLHDRQQVNPIHRARVDC